MYMHNVQLLNNNINVSTPHASHICYFICIFSVAVYNTSILHISTSFPYNRKRIGKIYRHPKPKFDLFFHAHILAFRYQFQVYFMYLKGIIASAELI